MPVSTTIFGKKKKAVFPATLSILKEFNPKFPKPYMYMYTSNVTWSMLRRVKCRNVVSGRNFVYKIFACFNPERTNSFLNF